VTSAAVRVQRLREETAKAVEAPWTVDADNHLGLASVRLPYADYAVAARAKGWRFDMCTPNDATAHHIARWDPKAAEKVLDLLAFVFDRHHEALNYDGDQQPLGICDREPVGWPCTHYRVALALLDTLDPEGAEHA
jgi:hypothetical protein